MMPMHIKLISNMLNHFTRPVVRIIAPKAAEIGHGLMSTIWKIWVFLININGD